MPLRLIHATANRPGAIAILQLLGDSGDVLRKLTGIHDWPLHRLRLANFADIDEGLAVRLTNDVAQFMPHGGPRVVQRLTAKLIELGVQIVADSFDESLDPCAIYPEAADRVEALTLHALARAQSPLAVDLLLDQPRRWRDRPGTSFSEEDRARSLRLNRLIDPPIVVLAGRPNVGKSTLSNALLGRAMSIAMNMPGTTRDYTAGRIDLAGLVVDWHDTPGIRESDDPIERKAIELARGLIERADLLIAMRDPDSDWPNLPREPDLFVLNKADLLPATSAGNAANASGRRMIAISASTGQNIATLVTAAKDALVLPSDLSNPNPWLFDRRLEETPRGA